MVKSNPKVVGIIGGMASGKSTISKLFARLGAKVVDADEIAHKVLSIHKVKLQLIKIFGGKIADKNGSLSRKAIADKVFASKGNVRRLIKIVHPLIRKGIDKKIAIADKDNIIIIDAALLCESGYILKCDKVVFVKTPLKVRERRAKNKGWSSKEIIRRERFQLPVNKKMLFADYIIDNSKTMNYAFKQVKKIYSEILN